MGAGGCCQRDVVALQSSLSFNFFSFDSFSFRSTQLGNGELATEQAERQRGYHVRVPTSKTVNKTQFGIFKLVNRIIVQ